MGEWQDIETAPKDGRKLRLKRMHEGQLVIDDIGYFGKLHQDAPQRFTLAGNALTPEMPPSDDVDEPRWCREDGMHTFPMPTHWLPEPPK